MSAGLSRGSQMRGHADPFAVRQSLPLSTRPLPPSQPSLHAQPRAANPGPARHFDSESGLNPLTPGTHYGSPHDVDFTPANRITQPHRGLQLIQSKAVSSSPSSAAAAAGRAPPSREREDRPQTNAVQSEATTLVQTAPTCSHCRLPEETLYQCPCGLARYCSTTCQWSHWPLHQTVCKNGIQGQKRPPLYHCQWCRRVGRNLRRCGCGFVYYCDPTCQKLDWSDHRFVCSTYTSRLVASTAKETAPRTQDAMTQTDPLMVLMSGLQVEAPESEVGTPLLNEEDNNTEEDDEMDDMGFSPGESEFMASQQHRESLVDLSVADRSHRWGTSYGNVDGAASSVRTTGMGSEARFGHSQRGTSLRRFGSRTRGSMTGGVSFSMMNENGYSLMSRGDGADMDASTTFARDYTQQPMAAQMAAAHCFIANEEAKTRRVLFAAFTEGRVRLQLQQLVIAESQEREAIVTEEVMWYLKDGFPAHKRLKEALFNYYYKR